MIRRLTVLATLATSAAPAFAQATVDPANAFCWNENAGFINWGSTNAPVQVWPNFLSGFAWGENIGWINLGDGTPTGSQYANINASDFGVNLEASTGLLSGYAWSENTGWINFAGGALASPANPARIDSTAQRLRGYAWSENVGWLNLDDASIYVGFDGLPLVCDSIDFNNDTSLFDPQDIEAFLSVYSEGPCIPATATCNDIDFNNDSSLFDPCDIASFLLAFSEGPCTPCGD